MDPFDQNCGGYVPPQLPADIYTVSHEHFDHNYREAVSNPESIRARYGMIEKGVRVSGIHTWHDRFRGKEFGPNEVFILDIDGLRIVHLGDLGHELDSIQLAALGRVDVLFIPIGGIYTINGRAASGVTKAVDASLTIPIHYYTPHLENGPFELEDNLDEYNTLCRRHVTQFNRNWVSLKTDDLPAGSIVVLHLD